MSRRHATIAVLGFAKALSDFFDAPENALRPGRLRALLQRLGRQTSAAFESLAPFSAADRSGAASLVEEFALISGWDGRERHVASIASFLAPIVTDEHAQAEGTLKRRLHAMIDTISEILDYYDRANGVHPMCYASGGRAADIWERIATGTAESRYQSRAVPPSATARSAVPAAR